MADYVNPFSAMPSPAEMAGQTPGMPGYANPFVMGPAMDRMQQAQPFVDMARQSQQLALQKEQQQQQEFMSPEAAAARSAELRWKTEESLGKMRSNPSAVNADIATSEAKIKTAGPEAQAKLDKMLLENNKIKGTAYEEMLGQLGDVGKQISTLKGMDKALAYQQAVQQVQAQFPDAKVPQSLLVWNQNTETNLEIARLSHLYSVKNTFDAQEKEKDRQARIKEAGISASAGPASAAITAAQSGANATLAYGSKEDQLKNQREQLITDAVSKDPRLKNIELQYLTAKTEAEQKALDAKVSRVRAEHESRIKAVAAQQSNPTGGEQVATPPPANVVPGYSRNGYRYKGPPTTFGSPESKKHSNWEKL